MDCVLSILPVLGLVENRHASQDTESYLDMISFRLISFLEGPGTSGVGFNKSYIKI
jgi:hypothetical protein